VDAFRIRGPVRLAGRVRTSGAKNATLPALAAALLTDEPLVLHDAPGVNDIRTMRRLLSSLGVPSETEAGTIRLLPQVDPPAAPTDEAHYDLVRTMRASVLVLGPLLARRGHARVSLPGGCAIGVRPIDQHLEGLRALGATVDLRAGYVDATAGRLRGARFRFDTPTVGGTENLLMAAVLAKGETVLENSACEPEIVDLACLLRRMGGRIEGAGTPTIRIEGVDALHGAEHSIIPDRIEAGTYLIGAALTGGDVTVENARPSDLGPLLDNLRTCGVDVDEDDTRIRLRAGDRLEPCDVTTAPHPGFPTDLQAQYMALMTAASGVTTVRETVFENRFQHVAELNRMGADIRVDGRTAIIAGPSRLSAAEVMATDLRASACLVLAGLAAHGDTVVHRIYHLDRGYERMELKLQEIGAHVERFTDS